MSSGLPRRVQLRRTKGWRKPEGTVLVTRPGRWGNPFRSADYRASHPDATVAQLHTLAVDDFRRLLDSDHDEAAYPRDLEPLRGHDLACWCPPGQACHADVLLERANAEPPR